jgi:hypothetical protein
MNHIYVAVDKHYKNGHLTIFELFIKNLITLNGIFYIINCTKYFFHLMILHKVPKFY